MDLIETPEPMPLPNGSFYLLQLVFPNRKIRDLSYNHEFDYGRLVAEGDITQKFGADFFIEHGQKTTPFGAKRWYGYEKKQAIELVISASRDFDLPALLETHDYAAIARPVSQLTLSLKAIEIDVNPAQFDQDLETLCNEYGLRKRTDITPRETISPHERRYSLRGFIFGPIRDVLSVYRLLIEHEMQYGPVKFDDIRFDYR